jgi:gentisate 1,2-dioxygenase
MEVTKRSQHKVVAQQPVNPVTMGGTSHVFRGSGTTMINGDAFHWQKGDIFIVPLWSWHKHVNAASNE